MRKSAFLTMVSSVCWVTPVFLASELPPAVFVRAPYYN
jgi:hypothetical protein